MRVFELAKTLKASSGTVLRAARELDLEAHSLLSSLDDADVSSLKKYFSSGTLPPPVSEDTLAIRRARVAALERKRVDNERKLLEDAIALARSLDTASKGVESASAEDPAPEPRASEGDAAEAAEADVAEKTEPVIEVAAIAAGEEESKVVIHADTSVLDRESAAEESSDSSVLATSVPDDFDADEELESAYVGGKRDQAAVYAKRPAARTRDPEALRSGVKPKAGKGKRTQGDEKETKPRLSDQEAKAKPPRRTKDSAVKAKPVGVLPSIPRGAAQPERERFTPLAAPVANTEKVLSVRGPVLIRELAKMMDIRPNRLIADLMQMNELVSLNQRVDIEKANKVAGKYGFSVELERARRSAARKPAIKRLDEEDDIPDDNPEDMKPRPPVVTFLGHVDHGKTSLMDAIRKTQQTSTEAGGITQHIGAYSVDLAGRKITFLDTPGHAAFSAMRARGANLTDVAVIIVAADDGIMPQTREVIRQCQEADVQIMVAINKCDLPTAKPDRIRQQLQAEGLTPEEWGGDLITCEVSAHTGAGLEHLLEMILLQADMLELQANPSRRADGYVIEAQMEQGRGPTATLLVASGTLKQGDVILVGEFFGRLRGLMDDRGRRILKAEPATAVRVMGLSGVPEAGAEFRVMVNEKRARELAEKFAAERKENELLAASRGASSVDDLFAQISEQGKRQLDIVIRGDTQGSVEAIIDSLNDIRSEKISLNIIDSGIGNVTTNDVQRAVTSGAMVVGFQVGLDTGVAAAARHEKIKVHTFRIIYELLDHIKQAMLDLILPEYREVVRGHAQIRAIFDIGGKGRIAGCQLLDGSVNRKDPVRIKRDREIIYEGQISTLRHFQSEVEEVRDLQECGISFVHFENFSEGDIVQSYAMEELERTL